MKCFYHPNIDAIGICYYCNRALCSDCAKDYSRGLACKGHCERAVEMMLITRTEKLHRGSYLLQRKRSGQPRPLSSQTKRLIVVSLSASLIMALFITHFTAHPASVRRVVEIGLCGTLCSLGIPVYLSYRRRDGGDR